MYRDENVLFANFGYVADSEVYVIKQNQTIKHDILTRRSQLLSQFGSLEGEFHVIHFEEFKPNNFLSIQFTSRTLNEHCSDCSAKGCQNCVSCKIYIFYATDISEARSVELGDNLWSYESYLSRSSCTAKITYNPQIRSLVAMINEK